MIVMYNNWSEQPSETLTYAFTAAGAIAVLAKTDTLDLVVGTVCIFVAVEAHPESRSQAASVYRLSEPVLTKVGCE